MSLDENGEAIAYTFRSTTEAGSSEGSWKGLKNLEQGSMDEQNEKICIEFLCTIFGASRTRLFLGVGESPKSLKGRCHWFRCHFLRSGSVNQCISGRFPAVLVLL